jgi:hypothetical protein
MHGVIASTAADACWLQLGKRQLGRRFSVPAHGSLRSRLWKPWAWRPGSLKLLEARLQDARLQDASAIICRPACTAHRLPSCSFRCLSHTQPRVWGTLQPGLTG